MDDSNLKTILKFDTGADGFLRMIGVLTVGAVIVLITGSIFLFNLIKDLKVIP